MFFCLFVPAVQFISPSDVTGAGLRRGKTAFLPHSAAGHFLI
jgi:hypothetical protein